MEKSITISNLFLDSVSARGVTNPPPSIAIGIIISRGDLRIGSPAMLILLPLSDSTVL